MPGPDHRPWTALRRVLRVLLGMVVALSVAAAAAYVYLQHERPRPLAAPEQSERRSQITALRVYAARRALGSLLPPSDAVVAIRQELLQSVVDRSLPMRQEFENGRYRVRLDRAQVRLEPGLAQVTLTGRGMLASNPEDSPLYTDLRVGGHLAVTGVDPDSGRLNVSLVVTELESHPPRPGDVHNLVNPVGRFFGRMRAEDWNRDRRPIHVPIRIEHAIVLPEIEGDVALSATVVPLAVQVSSVTTLDGRMAVSLALLPDSALGEPTRFQERLDWNRDPGPAPWRARGWREREDPALEMARLRTDVERLAERDPLWRSVVATDHDVVVLIPSSVLRRVVSRVSHRYLTGVDVTLRPHKVVPLRVRLHAKLLGGRVQVGRIDGQVRIGSVRGLLTLAGEPRVWLDPPHGLRVAMPARLVEGHGRVELDAEWHPAFLVGLVCRPFGVHETLAGDILPFDDTLHTEIQYQVLDSIVVGRPRLLREEVRVPVDLTDGSWGRVRERLVAQDRLGRCGLAMEPDTVLNKLQRLGDRGIRVRMPAHLFKPFRLPVLLEERYRAGGYEIGARTYDPSITVEADHLRLAFRADLRVLTTADSMVGATIQGRSDDPRRPDAVVAPVSAPVQADPAVARLLSGLRERSRVRYVRAVPRMDLPHVGGGR